MDNATDCIVEFVIAVIAPIVSKTITDWWMNRKRKQKKKPSKKKAKR